MRWRPFVGLGLAVGVALGGVTASGWAQGGGAGGASGSGTAQVGTLEGIVRTEAGTPLADVEVFVEGTILRATTATDGRFLVARLPAGWQRLIVRRIGYLPLQRDIRIETGKPLSLSLVMIRAALEMSPIAVTARREPSDSRLAGFRSRISKPGAGVIFTRERIEASSSRTVLDMIRTVPGLRVQPASRGSGIARTVRLRGGRCPPVVFIDGFAASGPEFDLESMDLNMVEGLEVYSSSASAPSEFFANARGQEQCGVIAIWSRPAQPRMPRVRPLPAEAVARLRAEARSADQVDQPGLLVSGPLAISYPDSLFRASVAGEVTVEFVVNARGLIEWSTMRVVYETHPAFSRSVLEALVEAQWEPARLKGQAVSQLVRVPVHFGR